MSAEAAAITVSTPSQSLTQPVLGPRYIVDGEPISLRDLLAVNDLSSDEVVRLRNLSPGQSLVIGGATLTRAPSEAA